MPQMTAFCEGQTLAAACAVQQRFMQHQETTAAHLDYAAHCRQVEQLGGDFYTFLPLADGRLAFAIGDASGKGLPAALMISSVHSSLRTAAAFTDYAVAPTIRAVNRQVYESSLAHSYATLFYGVFDQTANTLHYVNAGHHAPLVRHRNRSITWLEAGGAPVGLFPRSGYQQDTTHLQPGDTLLAFTDGIVEALNLNQEEWGTPNLVELFLTHDSDSAQDLVTATLTAMDRHTAHCQTDDATVLAIRVLDRQQTSRAA